MAEKTVWRIFDFRCGSESPSMSICRAMIAADMEVFSNEWLIVVAYYRWMACSFHLKHAMFHGVSS